MPGRLDEAQAGIKIDRRNINNLRYTDDTTLMEESKEELKSLLMQVKEKSEKAGCKFNIQETKIVASGFITSLQIDGETMETVTDFIFLGSKITADGDCSQEIKRHSLLGRKVMTNLDSLLKSRDLTLPTKVCLSKAVVFPVVIYGYESRTIKKTEHWRIDAFDLWCWRRLLRVPWTARRPNQSILKEISPEYSLEGLMLKLKFQYFGHLMRRAFFFPFTRKDPDTGKDWGQEEKGMTEDEMVGWHHRLNGHELKQATGAGDGQGSLACYSPWDCKESDITEQLNWTAEKINYTSSGFALSITGLLSCFQQQYLGSDHGLWFPEVPCFKISHLDCPRKTKGTEELSSTSSVHFFLQSTILLPRLVLYPHKHSRSFNF